MTTVSTDTERPTTTIIAPVPFVGARVEAVRAARDWSARRGVPAHITLLGNFAAPEQIDSETLHALRQIFSGTVPITTALSDLRLLGTTACLIPEALPQLDELSVKLASVAPGGEHVVPTHHHLTVARDCDVHGLADLRAALGEDLPLRGEINQARLLAHTGASNVAQIAGFDFGPQVRPARQSDVEETDLVDGMADRISSSWGVFGAVGARLVSWPRRGARGRGW